MKKIFAALAFMACGAALTRGAHPWAFEYRPFKASYNIFGGTLSEQVPPTKRSKNIAYYVKGVVAKQMFEAMGPNLKDVPGADGEQRIRQRAHVNCSFSPTGTAAVSASTL